MRRTPTKKKAAAADCSGLKYYSNRNLILNTGFSFSPQI